MITVQYRYYCDECKAGVSGCETMVVDAPAPVDINELMHLNSMHKESCSWRVRPGSESR